VSIVWEAKSLRLSCFSGSDQVKNASKLSSFGDEFCHKDWPSQTRSYVPVPPESGPGWLAIDPSGNSLYVVNHTTQSISGFSVNWKTGELNPIVSSPFPVDAQPGSIEVDADGAGFSLAHFHDSSISRFRIDRATGTLTPDPQ
jgi:DNA-binding beta-propeller fold protein YncE